MKIGKSKFRRLCLLLLSSLVVPAAGANPLVAIGGSLLNSIEHESQKDLAKENTKKIMNAIREVDALVSSLTDTVCSFYTRGLTTELDGIENRLNDYLIDTPAIPPQTRWTLPYVLLIQDLASRITTLRGAYKISNLTGNCQSEFDTFPMYVALTDLELNILAEESRSFVKNLYLTTPSGTVMDVSQISQAKRDEMYLAIHALIQSKFTDRLGGFTNQLKSLDKTGLRGKWWEQFSDSTFTEYRAREGCYKAFNDLQDLSCYEGANYDHREIEYSDTQYTVNKIHFSFLRLRWPLGSFNGPFVRSNEDNAVLRVPDAQYLYDPSRINNNGWNSPHTVFAYHKKDEYIAYARNVYEPLVPVIKGWLLLLDAGANGVRSVNYPNNLQVDKDLAGYVDYRLADFDRDGLADIMEARDYKTKRDSTDSDGDLVDDYYEVTHAGLDPNFFGDGQKDLDSDGYSNYQEYIAGSDASNAQSNPNTALAAKLIPIVELILN